MHAASSSNTRAAAAARHAQHEILARCSLTLLCELQVRRCMSLPDDNCNRDFSDVYSLSLHKGKPAAMRGRKASGPTARVRRIAGLPGRGFAKRLCRQPFLYRHSFLCVPAAAVKASPCDVSVRVTARCSGCLGNEEQRKLKRANPSKGGDAKPPVYRTSSYDSGVTSKSRIQTRYTRDLLPSSLLRARPAAPSDQRPDRAASVSLPVHLFAAAHCLDAVTCPTARGYKQ